MKLTSTLLSLIVMTVSVPAYSWDQKPNLPIESCKDQTPFGVPSLKKADTTLECHTAYALQHDNTAKIPAWVAYTLTPKHAVGCVARTNSFTADKILVAGSRSDPSDYVGSGFDQGHLAPDGDMSWDTQVEYESFLMSNMSPQYPNFNRGVWKSLETDVRAWSLGLNHSITVYAGNIYGPNSKTIGADKVVIPEKLFKIVIDDDSKTVLAFIIPNVEQQPVDLQSHLTSVLEVEKETGITFPVPNGTDKAAVAKTIWDADLKKLTDTKRQTCK
jgi:endonuclease G, mitochondrial